MIMKRNKVQLGAIVLVLLCYELANLLVSKEELLATCLTMKSSIQIWGKQLNVVKKKIPWQSLTEI